MARSNYSAGKRQREMEKAKRKKEKAARKAERSSQGTDIPIATVEELQGGLMTAEQVMANLKGENDESTSARTIPARLFVGGLDWGVNSERLRATFEAIGPVADATVVLDRDTGDSRGFGFVTMADRKDAAEAIRKLDGQDLDGRRLAVRQATERNR
jgi:RNA recognition motif-containing protein